jgi:hypothetical protein
MKTKTKPAGDPREIQTEHLPNTSLKPYRHANQDDFSNLVLCVTVRIAFNQ